MKDCNHRQLRHIFAITSGATPESGNPEYWDGDIPWVTPEDISSLASYRLYDTRRKITHSGYDNCGTRLVEKNSIVLTKRAPIGKVAVLAIDACSNQGCFLLTPKHASDSRFYYYWLIAKEEHLQALGRGSTFMELSTDELKALQAPAPRSDQQTAIANFLDRETARIDELIAEKEKLIVLIAEKRRALITHAVTRGLDQNALMRDSGIPWLGEIPAHWDVAPLRFLVEFSGGATPNTEKGELWNGDIPWVSPKDMKRTMIDDSEDHVTEQALSESSIRMIEPGAVLIVVRGMILAHSFPVAINTKPITINQDMKALRCHASLEPRYLLEYFRGIDRHIVSVAEESAHGTRKLETNVLGHLEIPIPPIVEQCAIVQHIAAEMTKLDLLRTSAAHTLMLLKERRSALIAAAVAGAIQLR